MKRSSRSSRCLLAVRRPRGAAMLELLAAVLILVIASAGAVATWSFTVQAPASRRLNEMGVFIAVRHLETLKAQKYSALQDTTGNTAVVAWYDRRGTPVTAQVNEGFRVETKILTIINRDGKVNTEDLREIEVRVSNNAGNIQYGSARTLAGFGAF